MKREYRLRDMIKEGILDIFYIWKDELKNVFKDEGVLIFFFLVPFAYPLLYSFKWYARRRWWLWTSPIPI